MILVYRSEGDDSPLIIEDSGPKLEALARSHGQAGRDVVRVRLGDENKVRAIYQCSS